MQNKKIIRMMFGLCCLAVTILVCIGTYFDSVFTFIHTPVRKLVSTFNTDFYAEPLPFQRLFTTPEQRYLQKDKFSKTMSYVSKVSGKLSQSSKDDPLQDSKDNTAEDLNVDPIQDSKAAPAQDANFVTVPNVKAGPIHHIAFIKVHKAASTTVQNIFLRYGYENDLVFALPRIGSTISVQQTVRPDNILPPPPNRGYDILCAHVRYNRDAFENILPNDSKYFGIVREPFRHFQSNLQYYRQRYVVNIPGDRPVRDYLLHIDQHMKFGGHIPTTYNRMAFDFGFPNELFWSNNNTEIQRYLLKLDDEIDLVLVTEYFDESIVLMRRLLNWDLKYVLYGKLNSKQKIDPRLVIGPEEENLYKNWARIDYALYDFFLKKLKDKIEEQPPDFYEELTYFRKTRTKYDHFCLSALNNGPTDIAFKGSQWNKPFVVTKEHCKHLYIREIPFFNQLRARRQIQVNRMKLKSSQITYV